MLQLKKLGIDDFVHFDFVDPPPHLFDNQLLHVSKMKSSLRNALDEDRAF